FFKFHADPTISSYAVEQIAERYQLSRSFQEIKPTRLKGAGEQVVTEADQLPDLVPRLLLELQYTIICRSIDQHEGLLQQVQNDNEAFEAWHRQYKALIDTRNAISKELGDRVIIV
ncbi:MAG: hypothetical protein IJR74_03415, partial [Paludibacteraceae bacterium]|nr:hypothetical protein [Paludibacteraceae bacterium]